MSGNKNSLGAPRVLFTTHLQYCYPQTRDDDPMLCLRWPNVYDAGPTSTQHWVATEYNFGLITIHNSALKTYDRCQGITTHWVLRVFYSQLTCSTATRKHETLTQCCVDVGPTYTTLAQHQLNIGWVFNYNNSQDAPVAVHNSPNVITCLRGVIHSKLSSC